MFDDELGELFITDSDKVFAEILRQQIKIKIYEVIWI